MTSALFYKIIFISVLNFLSSLILSSFLSFGSPVNYEVSLAGNFGEPRPNHFHGGIDVRTGMVEGKPIFSVADGYVCRITVGLDGFGNAVYVRHPGGITTVYCHLKKFIPQLAAMVQKWQYQHQTCFADVQLRPTDFPVSQGQLIAVSGNSGASYAPHLHLEFHDTRTWNFLDPLDFLKPFVTDTTAPIAHSFMAYPIKGEGVFCGSQKKQSFGFTSTSLTRDFWAWGKVGFGIWANDYMEGSFGILGIRKTTLAVDGNIVFESVVDNIPTRCNRMVNSWGDYEHYCRTHTWYMKSFAEPGNTLPVFQTMQGNRGVIDFNEERDYNLVYTISDIFGNSRSYSFIVHGRKQYISSSPKQNVSCMLSYDRLNSFQRPGMALIVRPGLLPDDVELSPRMASEPDALSNKWSFYGQSWPRFGWARISWKLNKPGKDPSKLYIVSHYGVDRYMGGTFKDGWVTGRIRELGAWYEIAYDDEAPVLTSFSMSAGKLFITAYDDKTGLRSIKGFVDGQFVLFEYMEKSKRYVCNLAYSPVKKTGGSHKLKIIAMDNRGNSKEFTSQFDY